MDAAKSDQTVGPGLSPVVRALLRLHGIDVTSIRGTGRDGRVTKKDVDAAVAARRAVTGALPQGPTPANRLVAAPDQRIPISRARRLIAENMVRAKTTIPHAWQAQEVDMSGVVASRHAHRHDLAEAEGIKLTYLPYVVKAVALALREHPRLNSTYTDEAIIVHGDVSIGIAVGLEDAVVVPVIPRTDQLSIAEIARAASDLAGRVHSGRLRSDDLSAGTFTVNNSGTYGTVLSYSVIAPGQAGILTMGAVVDRPVADDGVMRIKPMMYACLSLDHRLVDGFGAAGFLTACRRWIEGVTPATPIW